MPKFVAKSSVHHDNKHYPKGHEVDPSDSGFKALKEQGLLEDFDDVSAKVPTVDQNAKPEVRQPHKRPEPSKGKNESED